MKQKILLCLMILLSLILLSLILLSLILLSGCAKANVELYNGDILYKTVSVKVGDEYNFGKPEKMGYRFQGWYDAPEGGNVMTDAEGSSAGMTWKSDALTKLYARWEPNTYKITFDYAGATSGNNIADVSVVYDEEITANFPVPQKAGYSFVGWFTSVTGGEQITDSDGTFTENGRVYSKDVFPMDENGTTLYAHWDERQVKFFFFTDGDEVKSLSYPVGTILYELPASLKDNYCFIEWCFDETLLLPMQFPYAIDNDSESVVNLYAKFLEGSNNELVFNSITATGDREYEVSYSGNAKRIVVPDSYYGKKVTSVKKISSQTLEEIILPQTMKQFGSKAFENCTALRKINIPYAIEDLPESVFSGCKNLEQVSLPIKLKSIGASAFAGCEKIRQLDLASALTFIGSGAFRNMYALEQFNFVQPNERYYEIDGVLYYKVGTTASLVQYPASKKGDTYSIASDTVKILEYAFSGSRIKFLEVGGKINRLEKGAFENCKMLFNVSITTQAINFSIDDQVFSGCSNLKAIKLEFNKVPVLGSNSFDGVSNIFSVYVPSGMIRQYQTSTNWRNIADKIYSLGSIFGDFALQEVEGGYAIRQYFGTAEELEIPSVINAKPIIEISENAFSYSTLKKVVLSENVHRIGSFAFANSDQLEMVVVKGSPAQLEQNVFQDISSDFAIYVDGSIELLDTYRIAAGWSEFANRIWSWSAQN